ncbi:MAG: protein kinase [Candidatus Aminicenantes bacterium]|nr:protein kinase [Candidatus Aminicenantes bacterium]
MGIKCPQCHFENPEDTIYCGKCATQLKSSEEVSASPTETVEPHKEELTSGSTFAGRYQIIEELGKGGMGKVYRVVDKKLDEEVALKLIKPEIAFDRKTIERFSKELKFARKIVHKNVGRMYELMEDEGRYFITMEYVSGQDLKGLIRQTGQLTIGKSISIAKQVCEGLAEAHKLGVVHRDLKPHNIMIDKEGNARIMDFGIARSLEAEGITDAKAIIGTPKYMSPEQVEGEEVDQRSDIYSLGIIIYEMVTEKTPFDGDTALSIALKHKTQAPPEPREFNAQIPEDLSQVILKCLEKDKQKRYQSAEEVLSELSSIEKRFPTEKMIISEKRLGLETKRKRFQSFLIPGIVLFVAVIIVAGYFFFGQLRKNGEISTKSIGEMKWKSSIAMLPVEDLSPQKDQESLCEAMHDDIITKLRILIPDLRVMSKLAVMRYTNKDKSSTEIGKELNVETILESSLRKAGENIQMNVRLINVKDGSVIWSYTFKEKSEGLFKIQDEIFQAIASELKVHLQEEQIPVIKTREPKNIKAREYYVWGNHFEEKYANSRQEKDFEEGVKNYTEALKIDPNYALAYWSLGDIYQLHFAFSHYENWKSYDLMNKSYESAYQINPNLAEANLGLGWAYFFKEDLDRSYYFFKKAFELDAHNPLVSFNFGSFLRSIGLYSQAINYYSRSIELDPLSILPYVMLSDCYVRIGEFDEVADCVNKALDIEEDNYWFYLAYAEALIMMKKYDDAGEKIGRAEKLNPKSPKIRNCRALILAIKGEKKKALTLIEGIEGRDKYRYDITSIYSVLGMKDKAIENIKIGIDTGFRELKEYRYTYQVLINNPFYESLHDDPRFKEIVDREKKKYDERLERYGQF